MKKVRRRRKHLVKVLAPEYFENREIGYIMSSTPENLIGRTIEVPLVKLTGFPLHNYMVCKLRIVKVRDHTASTIYYGHRYFREYIQALFSKGTSYVDIFRDVTVREGIRYRVQAGVYTKRRISTSRKRAIRRRVFDVLDKHNNEENLKFLKAALYGVIDAEIGVAAKKIYPVRWVGIQKMKLIKLN